MAGGPRRLPIESLNFHPTPISRRLQYSNISNTPRLSDASFASSCPSGITPSASSNIVELPVDRAQQASAVRAINDYLASHSCRISLRTHPVSSAKDITDVLQFLFQQLDYPCTKLEDDILVLLKGLDCPFNVKKSTLRAPNTPHNWPSFLAVMYWMMQAALLKEHRMGSWRNIAESEAMLMFWLDSYSKYMQGDDDAVEVFDREFMEKVCGQRDKETEEVNRIKTTFEELERRVEALRNAPSKIDELEKQRIMLEGDREKYGVMITEFNQRKDSLERVLEEKSKEFERKMMEKKRIQEENEDLKKRIEAQSFNARDVERMKRELTSMERTIEDSDAARNIWVEKIWETDSTIENKLKDLESLAMECNQAVRRLKLGKDFHFSFNKNGSATDVMGVDYKSTLKPLINSSVDDIKKNYVENLEELMSLQQQSSEKVTKLEEKRNLIATYQTKLDKLASKISLLKKEMEDHTFQCTEEARRMSENVRFQNRNLESLEQEAKSALQAVEPNIQEEIRGGEEEMQWYARQLLAIIDLIAGHKEFKESKVSDMQNKLTETVSTISNTYNGSLLAQFNINLKPISGWAIGR